MYDLKITSTSTEYTQKLGYHLGLIAKSGFVYLLSGNLGGGKTCLTQGIARGMDITSNVTSPTFVLVREHHGRIPLYHIDLYRLDNINEIIDLGLEEYFASNGLCVIEWADKGLEVFPKEHLLILIEYVDETTRNITIKPDGEIYIETLNNLREHIKAWNLQ